MTDIPDTVGEFNLERDETTPDDFEYDRVIAWSRSSPLKADVGSTNLETVTIVKESGFTNYEVRKRYGQANLHPAHRWSPDFFDSTPDLDHAIRSAVDLMMFLQEQG